MSCAYILVFLISWGKKCCRPETDEEKALKEEIDHLRKELEEQSNLNGESVQASGGHQPSLHDIILDKEAELEKLAHELDDKVRFGQKAIERPGSGAGRPGSGAGRAGSFLERTPSQSGSIDESRSVGLSDRPRSRGTGDMYARPADDRKAFQGGRERGFLGSRDLDRWAYIVFLIVFLRIILKFTLDIILVFIIKVYSEILVIFQFLIKYFLVFWLNL